MTFRDRLDDRLDRIDDEQTAMSEGELDVTTLVEGEEFRNDRWLAQETRALRDQRERFEDCEVLDR